MHFCIVQRATAQSKKGNFRDYGGAEAPRAIHRNECMFYNKNE
jgi:hypothetical protein